MPGLRSFTTIAIVADIWPDVARLHSSSSEGHLTPSEIASSVRLAVSSRVWFLFRDLRRVVQVWSPFLQIGLAVCVQKRKTNPP